MARARWSRGGGSARVAREEEGALRWLLTIVAVGLLAFNVLALRGHGVPLPIALLGAFGPFCAGVLFARNHPLLTKGAAHGDRT